MKNVALCGLMIVVVLSGSAVPAQTPATGRVMRTKLAHAQGLLEALTTSDHAALVRHSEELARATRAAGWEVLKTAEYRRHTESFLRAVEDLGVAAKERDLDAAIVHYQTMTMSCYQCHRYVQRARIAGPIGQ
jgi:hypothetical protein